MKQFAPGVEYYEDEHVLLLLRCPKCGRENYAMNVAKGICTWCGYDAHELLKEESTRLPVPPDKCETPLG